MTNDQQIVHDRFLPFTEVEMHEHFAAVADATNDPQRHLAAWRQRIAEAAEKPGDYLHRDETLWTAGALVGVHRSANPRAAWARLLEIGFGPRPPLADIPSWDAFLEGDLKLYLEVGLPSPASYSSWLRERLTDQHPLGPRVALGAASSRALEGRTHLDAMLLNVSNGCAVHVESKVLSDISPSVTFDAIRNQIARNLDCMAEPAQSGSLDIAARDSARSLFVLLTPDLFRRHWQSRLYGHLLREYQRDGAALQRDLSHRSTAECESLSRRCGWIAFEDVAAAAPGTCLWLEAATGG